MNGELGGLFSLVGDSILAAVLIWFIWQFRSGEIMSRSVHDEIIASYEKRIEAMRTEMEAAVSAVMERLENLAEAHVAICPFVSSEATEKWLEAIRGEFSRDSVPRRMAS